MKPDQFCLWLRGFFEITAPTEITRAQTTAIRDRLYSVFDHVVEPVETQGEPVETQGEPVVVASGKSKSNIYGQTHEEWVQNGRPRC